jgi:hypothetical protein
MSPTTETKPPGFFARMILALPVVRRAAEKLSDEVERIYLKQLAEILGEHEEEIRALQSKLETSKPKIQPAAGPLAADEVLDAFSVTEREPWFAATMQEIEGLIEEATRITEAGPTGVCNPETRPHAAGCLFALRDVRERLHALRETATGREEVAGSE